MLTLISGCTYIMVASSAYRMILYISSYQLTFLRVFVLWALLMIALILGGVILYIWNQEFDLFRYLLITVTIGYLTFAGIHPDYWIARYNITQEMQGESMDSRYLVYDLSLDAAPAVYELTKVNDSPENRRRIDYILAEYDWKVDCETENMSIRSWNASRVYAEIVKNRSR